MVATIAYMDPTIWADPRHRDALADVLCGLLLWSVLRGRDLLPGWTPHALHDELAGSAQAYLPSSYGAFSKIVAHAHRASRRSRKTSITRVWALLCRVMRVNSCTAPSQALA